MAVDKKIILTESLKKRFQSLIQEKNKFDNDFNRKMNEYINVIVETKGFDKENYIYELSRDLTCITVKKEVPKSITKENDKT